MSTTINLTTSPVSVPLLTGNQLMIVEHTGGNMVYYRSTSNVGPQTNDGVLTLGQTTQFYSGPVWFASDSTAQIIVTYIPSPITPQSIVAVGAAAPGSGATGDLFIVRSDGTIARVAAPTIPVEAWGAIGDGAADDTTKIQDAINALPQTGNTETSGGRLKFAPNKTYKITSPLVVDALVGVTLDGGSGGTHGGAVISGAFTAGSSNSIISARSAKSFTITGGLTLVNSDTTYAGTAIDLSTRPADVNSSNTDRASLKRFRIDLAANAGSTATGILLANAQACDIEDGWITGGRDAIVGLLVNTDFSNSNSISKTQFQNQNRIPIHNPGQGWTIGPRNVFEPILGGAAGSLLMDASLASTQEGFAYLANSHQDASTSGTWVTLNGGNGASLQGNFFATGDKCLAIGGAYAGLSITGNTVYSANTAAWDFGPSSPTNVLCAGNRYGPGTVTATTSGAVGDGSLVLDSTTAGLNEIIFPGTTLIQRVASGAVQMFNVLQQVKTAPTYSASITPGHNNGSWQVITVTNGTAFTINAPTNPPSSNRNAELTIEVLNSSGGAMGVITWNAIFKFAGLTWTNPANTLKRYARFEWNGANWICISIATADY